MKKALITGGAGFIGYHLANKLIKSNYHVELLDNFSRGVKDEHLIELSKSEKIKIINSDLLRPIVAHQFPDNYDYIYHLAAVIGVQHVLNSPYNVLGNNFILLHNALNIAQKQKDLN